MYDYEPFRQLLKDKNIKQSTLINEGVINRHNASKLKNNKSLTIDTLHKLCKYFDCQFSDIVRYIK